MNILIGLLLVVLVLICVLLIITILMQPSKADSGVGAAFGGQATDALFGASSPTVLAKFTAYLTVAFFALCFLLGILIHRNTHAKTLGERFLEKSFPSAIPAPKEAPAAEPAVGEEPTAAPSPAESPQSP